MKYSIVKHEACSSLRSLETEELFQAGQRRRKISIRFWNKNRALGASATSQRSKKVLRNSSAKFRPHLPPKMSLCKGQHLATVATVSDSYERDLCCGLKKL